MSSGPVKICFANGKEVSVELNESERLELLEGLLSGFGFKTLQVVRTESCKSEESEPEEKLPLIPMAAPQRPIFTFKDERATEFLQKQPPNAVYADLDTFANELIEPLNAISDSCSYIAVWTKQSQYVLLACKTKGCRFKLEFKFKLSAAKKPEQIQRFKTRCLDHNQQAHQKAKMK